MKSACFPPVARADARVLLLGSLPGATSLSRGEYYAKPQNAFWRIMGSLFNFAVDLPYLQRLNVLAQNHIALWDVCATATRPGSLDTSITDAVANDFTAFFQSHPAIKWVFFNGATAEKLYTRHVAARLPTTIGPLQYHRLPSTSPANAGMTFSKKFDRWSVIRKYAQGM